MMKRVSLFILILAAAGPITSLVAGEKSSPPPAPSPSPPGRAVRGGFTRFIPDRDGEYEWKLTGDEASFLSPVSLEITRLTATGLVPRLEGLTIDAESVLYFTNTGISRHGDSRIVVRRENSVLTGRGFLWIPDRQEIRVFEDVRFLIREEGQGGLFPL